MNRVIRASALATEPVSLDAGTTRFIDGELAEIMEQVRAQAFEEGRRTGAADARSDLSQIAQRIDTAIQNAVAGANQLRAAVITEALEAGLAVAEFITGNTVTDPTALAARIREALAGLDDETIVVGINPQDWQAVSDAVRLPPNVTIDSDPTLGPGEARIQGTWSSIDMSRQAALEIAREVLS